MNSGRGFTLIELLVVVSIVAFLSSIIFAVVGTARVDANNTAIVAQSQQFQKAIQLATDQNGRLPVTPVGTYYCLGKPASGSCNFWSTTSNTITGSDALHTLLSPIISTVGTEVPTVTIDGYAYKGVVYECTALSTDGTQCQSAIVYWAQNKATCRVGAVAYTGTDGKVVCKQDAGVTDSSGSHVANATDRNAKTILDINALVAANEAWKASHIAPGRGGMYIGDPFSQGISSGICIGTSNAQGTTCASLINDTVNAAFDSVMATVPSMEFALYTTSGDVNGYTYSSSGECLRVEPYAPKTNEGPKSCENYILVWYLEGGGQSCGVTGASGSNVVASPQSWNGYTPPSDLRLTQCRLVK